MLDVSAVIASGARGAEVLLGVPIASHCDGKDMVHLLSFLGASCGAYLTTVVVALKYLEPNLLPWSVVLRFPTHGLTGKLSRCIA